MVEFKREDFKKIFGCGPGKLFDLSKILTEEHRIEAMRLPDPKLVRVRREYGTLVDDTGNLPDLIHCIEVHYHVEDGRFKAVIDTVWIFDDQAEQDLHKAATAAVAPPNVDLN